MVEAANRSAKRTKTEKLCYTPEVISLGRARSLASAEMGCEPLTISSSRLDGIDGRMNKYTHYVLNTSEKIYKHISLCK